MSAGSPSGQVAYLDERRPCGGCGHTTRDHWTEDTGSVACTRPGCGCRSWWSMADLTPEEDPTDDRAGRGGPRVVTLCGSMRFWPLMLTVAAAETAAGAVVLAPFVVIARAAQDTALKTGLDRLHRAKIAMSTSVLVVTDPSGYWGESTGAEIRYAIERGLTVMVRSVDLVTGTVTSSGPLTWAHGCAGVTR